MAINYKKLRQQERLIRAGGNSSSDKDEKLLELAMKYIDDQDLFDLNDYLSRAGYESVPRRYLAYGSWQQLLFIKSGIPKGDLNEAMRIKDLIINPVFKEQLLQMIAISYLKQSNHQEAINIYREMKITEFEQKLAELIGISCAHAGKIETAKGFIDLSGPFKENILKEIIGFLIQAGNLKEAEDTAHLMDYKHRTDEYLLQIGDIYFRQGDILEALRVYNTLERNTWPITKVVIHFIKEKNIEAAEAIFKTIKIFESLDSSSPLFKIIAEYIKGGYYEQAKNASRFPMVPVYKDRVGFELKPMQSDIVLSSMVESLLDKRIDYMKITKPVYDIKMAKQVYKLIENPQYKKKSKNIIEQIDQKQFQNYITRVQADKSFLQQLKAIQNIEDKKQHLRRKYNFQSSPEFDEYLKAYLQQGIEPFNKRKQLRIKKMQYFAERKRLGLPIIDQQKQSEQDRISIISRIERSIGFLEKLKAQPNLHENSIKFIHDAQFALIEANNILTANPQQYYRRKNVWIGFLRKHDIYLHDDKSNKTGFLFNVYNILDAIEKLGEKQTQQVKKLTSRINPMCLDGKIDSLRRFLLSIIVVDQPFLTTCGNLITEAIAALPQGIKKMSRLEFINMLLRSTDMDELIMTLETDFDYRKKAAEELSVVLQERKIVPQNFIANTPKEKFSLVNLIVDGILKLSYEVNEQGQILFE